MVLEPCGPLLLPSFPPYCRPSVVCSLQSQASSGTGISGFSGIWASDILQSRRADPVLGSDNSDISYNLLMTRLLWSAFQHFTIYQALSHTVSGFSSFIQQMHTYACLSGHSMSRMGEAVPGLGVCELVAGLRQVHGRTSRM